MKTAKMIIIFIAFVAFLASCEKNNDATPLTGETHRETRPGNDPPIALGQLKVSFMPALSMPSDFIIGTTTVTNTGVFNLLSTNPGGSTVTEMVITIPTNTSTSVSLSIGASMIAASNVVGNIAQFYGLNISIPFNSSVNITTGVTLMNVGIGGAVSNSDVNLTITSVKYTSNNSGIIKTIQPNVMGYNYKLVSTKPMINMNPSTGPGLTNGSVQIGLFSVTAETHGDLKINQIPILVNISGSASIVPGSVVLRDATVGGGSIIIGNGGSNGSVGLNGSGNFVFTTPRTIPAGSSETYTVWATFSGVTGGAGTQSVSFSLGNKTSFLWTDVAGNTPNISGNYIYDWPTSTQTKTN